MRHLSILATLVFLVASLQAQVPNYVPTDGLVGWWPFNGNANDESGNDNDGTVNGAILTPDRFGNSNSAYSFNDSYISTEYLGISGSSPRSFSLWMNATTENSGTNSWELMGYGYDGQPGSSFYCIVTGNTNNDVALDISNAVKTYDVNLGTSNWNHIAVVYDPAYGENVSAPKIYMNGVLLSNPSTIFGTQYQLNTALNALYPLSFGGLYPNYRFDGELDDIGMWSRALDECEIQGLYNAGGQGVSSTPVSYTGLNDSYTITDGPATLIGSPTGGYFIGPGVSGSTFDPAAAGVGTHSITYTWFDACGGFNTIGLCTTVDQGVGIGGNNLDTGGVLVYPNPNRGQFTLEVDLVGLVSLQVYDAGGRLAHSEVFQATGTKTIRNLDLSGKAKGTYSLQVRNDGGVVTQMVVVE